MTLASILLATIYYAGVVGPRASGVERQLGELLAREAGTETIVLDEPLRRAIALRQRPARRSVRELGGEGLVIGRLRAGSSFVLQAVLYDGGGQVRGRFDIPLGQAALDAAAEERVRREVLPRLREIAPSARPKPASPAPAPAAIEAEPEPEGADGADEEPASERVPAPAPAKVASAAAPVVILVRPRDQGALPGLTTEASLGVDFVSRSFTPEPRAIPAYQITSVPALRLHGNIDPVSWLAFAFSIDRAIGLDSRLLGQPVPTTLSVWQLRANLMARRNGFAVGGTIGYGHRSFAIESKSPARSPDGDYGHLVAGVRSRVDLGAQVSLIGEVAFEPVVSGDESTMAAYGTAQRWGLEANGAVQWQLGSFLLLGAHAGYQRFAWDWPARGLGGAVDDYVTLGLSAGVRLVPVQ